MSPKDQNAVVSFFEVENKIDEMFRVVEVEFQACNRSSGSNLLLMVAAWKLKQFRDGDNFNKFFIFNLL